MCRPSGLGATLFPLSIILANAPHALAGETPAKDKSASEHIGIRCSFRTNIKELTPLQVASCHCTETSFHVARSVWSRVDEAQSPNLSAGDRIVEVDIGAVPLRGQSTQEIALLPSFGAKFARSKQYGLARAPWSTQTVALARAIVNEVALPFGALGSR